MRLICYSSVVLLLGGFAFIGCSNSFTKRNMTDARNNQDSTMNHQGGTINSQGTTMNNWVTTLKDTLETRKQSAPYQPAFSTQTRAKKMETKTPYKVETIAENIGKPWAVIPLNDDRLLISDKMGTMAIYSTTGQMLKKITGLPKVASEGQGGLLDLALDPDFDNNRMIYFAFSEKFGVGSTTAIAKGTLAPDEQTLRGITVIYRVEPALDSDKHFGARLVFDKDGHLFFCMADRFELEGRKQAQWLHSGIGKIFKITTDGKPASGNPTFSGAKAQPGIYSYGHRNPQGLDIHPETGELWSAEFGPLGGDELNLIKPGANYGWPTITYGLEYNGDTIGEGITQKEGMEQPVYYWDPVLSPSGMVFYNGDAIPEWKNNLFIGGLNSLHLSRVIIENNRVVGEERLLVDKKERIRDVAYSNGKLYVITDGGFLYKISPQ